MLSESLSSEDGAVISNNVPRAASGLHLPPGDSMVRQADKLRQK